MSQKPILRALSGERLPVPPVWMMRQAGRYLPEYRATRAQAGDFLSLCYTPDLAAEVTLQPIRRCWLRRGDSVRRHPAGAAGAGGGSVVRDRRRPAAFDDHRCQGVAALKPVEAIHETLNPVYETVRILARELPPEVTLIGFAGAPWTVATYMIAVGAARPIRDRPMR